MRGNVQNCGNFNYVNIDFRQVSLIMCSLQNTFNIESINMYFPRSIIFDYTVRLAYSVSTNQVCRLVYTFELTEDNKRSLDKEADQRL